MNPNIDKKDIKISFQAILLILNIICDCLKYINKNLEDFIKYKNIIKKSENKAYELISLNQALLSYYLYLIPCHVR